MIKLDENVISLMKIRKRSVQACSFDEHDDEERESALSLFDDFADQIEAQSFGRTSSRTNVSSNSSQTKSNRISNKYRPG
jgi:hypothetical protein